jgi:8-oxo-dGTP pyrophosphatase MutT (NUDIX family)
MVEHYNNAAARGLPKARNPVTMFTMAKDTISTKFRGRVITVNVETVTLPNGAVADFEIIHHPGGAAVVAIDEQQRVCLLRQFRPAAYGWVWELPAGRLEPAEPPSETARRELIEEAGCEAARWDDLGSILSSPGVFAEILHLYLARDLRHVATAREVHEVMEVHWIAFPEAVRRALSGEIRDGKTIIALLRAQAVLEGLKVDDCSQT